MAQREIQVFKLNGLPVFFWGDYGAVAPSLWTTNGSIGYVAKYASEGVRHGWKVTESILHGDLDFSDTEALRVALVEAYRVWDVSSQVGG